MFPSSRLGRLSLLLAVGSLVLHADGTQVGSLAGRVADPAGQPIAGARVKLSGPALLGVREVRTGSDGTFRLLQLSPGQDYRVEASAPNHESNGGRARIRAGQTTQVNLVLQPIPATVVEVIGASTTIDTGATTSQTTVPRDLVDRLPIGRTYQDLMLLAPGVTYGGNNPTALGGRSTENLYLVDGVDTTDATTGTWGLNLNEEAIEEVQTLTTGIGAQYGRFNGAVSNVVTRSGGNTFEGALRWDFSNVAWNARRPMDPVAPEGKLVTSTYVTLGGPLVPDRLWFFLSTNFIRTSVQEYTGGAAGGAGVPFQRTFRSDPSYFSAKLTWQLDPSHRLVLQHTGDPARLENVQYGFASYGTTSTPDTLTHQRQGGTFSSVTYYGILSPTLTLEAKLARQETKIENQGAGGQRWAFFDVSDNFRSYENGPWEGYAKRPRTQGNLAVNWFPELLGSHQITAGVDVQRTESRSKWTAIGNVWVYFYGFLDGEGVRTLDYDLYGMGAEVYGPAVENTSTNRTVATYLNDTWKVNAHWALNLGVRMEQAQGTNDIGERIWDFRHTSPRLALSFDPTGHGRRLFGATFGRYHFQPWQDGLDSRNRLRQSWAWFAYNGSGDPHVLSSYTQDGDWVHPQADPNNRYDARLKAPHQDETTLFYKAMPSDRLSYQATLVHRTFRNPVVNFRYYERPSADARVDYLTNAGDARRTYRALMLQADYRSERWQVLGTYTYSTLKGNHDADNPYSYFGTFTQGAYVPGPTLNPSRVDGFLSADRTQVARLLVQRRMELGRRVRLDHGLRFEYSSGAPYSLGATRFDRTAPGWLRWGDNTFVAYQGERNGQRLPATWRLHYSVTAEVRLSSRVSAFVKVDLRNVLNTFKVENWNRAMTFVNDVDGSGQLLNTGTFKRGSLFGQANSPEMYTPPRTVLLSAGLRF